MADALSRAQIFFETAGTPAPIGWTETYYTTQSDLQVLIDTIMQKYVPKRKQLLGIGAKIKFLRVTNIPPNRVSRVEYLTGKDGEGVLFSSVDVDNTDPLQVDLLCRASTAAGKRRQLWVGGLPDSQTNQLLAQGIKAAFVNQPSWKQFKTAITEAGFGIRYKIAAGPPVLYEFNLIQEVQPIMVRNRKKGRPFDLFRGRQLA